MSRFLGTHPNRLDSKGRVSIPAPFRAALRTLSPDGTAALVLRPSHNHPCIEGWPAALFEALAAPLDQMDTFSEAHDDLSAALYADAYPLEADKEGRVVVPEALLAHAGIQDVLAFVGVGGRFQIWEPAAAQRRLAQAREAARTRGLTLPGARAPGGSRGDGPGDGRRGDGSGGDGPGSDGPGGAA